MKRALVILIVGLLATPCAFGATAASDDGSQAAYADGWQNGDNGGSGWGGGWTVSSSGNAGYWAPGNSVNNGNDGTTGQDNNFDGDIGSEAWGLWATNGALSDAVRPFDGSLSVGQSFSIDFDNGWNDGTVGIGLQNSSGENLVEWYHASGNGEYTVNDGDGLESSFGWTAEGMTLLFTLTGASSYSLQATRLETSTVSNHVGNLLNPAGGQDVTQVRIFNAGSAGNNQGAEYDLFANNMGINAIPEPTTIAFFGIGALAFFLRRRR